MSEWTVDRACAGASGQHGKVTCLVKEHTAVLRPVFPILEGLVEDHVRAHENARLGVCAVLRFGDPPERRWAGDRPRRVIGRSNLLLQHEEGKPHPGPAGRILRASRNNVWLARPPGCLHLLGRASCDLEVHQLEVSWFAFFLKRLLKIFLGVFDHLFFEICQHRPCGGHLGRLWCVVD